MANWILFSDTTSEHTAVLINLDRVKTVQPGTDFGTMKIDGALVWGDFDQLQLMLGAQTCPSAR